MPRRAAVDWRAVAAAAPLSVIRRRELLALGVPESTIARRTAPGGPWVVVIMGVVALVRGTLTTEQRTRAGLLFAGDDAVLTGPTACRLYGLANATDDGMVHVLVGHERRRSSRSFVRIERTRHLPEPRTRDGFPVVSVARAVVDAARAITRLDGVRALVAEAVQTRRATPQQLWEEYVQGTRRGTALLHTVLEEIDEGMRSAVEGWALEVARELHAEGFPEIRFNVRVRTLDGEHLVTADGWVEEVAMAWEIQSFQFHLSPEHMERSMAHVARLLDHHVIVAETLPKHLKTRRDEVKAELWRRYRLAASRPRPPVTGE